MGQGESKGKE